MRPSDDSTNPRANNTNSTCWVRRYRSPAMTPAYSRVLLANGWNCAERITSTVAMTAPKLAALRQNNAGSPITAASTPARLMPSTLPTALVTEFHANALPRSERGTTWLAKRPRAGPSNVPTKPAIVVSANSTGNGKPCHTVTASSKAMTRCSDSPITMMRRGDTRSAKAPAHGPHTIAGMVLNATDRPTEVAEPVRSITTQFRPSTCIQVPVTDTRSAKAHSR